MMGLTAAIDSMELNGITNEIKRAMRRSAKDAVQLGYMLRRVMEEKLWEEKYADFDSYLQTELQKGGEIMKERRGDPMKDYLDYLGRMRRIHNIDIWQLHQLALSREVAREYGLTEEKIKQLDEDL